MASWTKTKSCFVLISVDYIRRRLKKVLLRDLTHLKAIFKEKNTENFQKALLT